MIDKGIQYIQNLWSKEWVLKVSSLLIAIIIWSFVGGEERVDKNVLIPLEVINQPRDLIISHQLKKDVEVTINGPRSMLLDFNKSAVSIQVDLSNMGPGSKVMEITPEMIKMPRHISGISIERIQPASIVLSLDKLVQKEFPINPITMGKLPKGYFLNSLILDPPTLTVTGPSSLLAQYDVLRTREINLDGLMKKTSLQIPLDLPQNIVELIGEVTITADVVIGVDLVEKVYEDVGVQINNSERYNLVPSKVSVRASVPRNFITNRMHADVLFTVKANRKPNSERVEFVATVRENTTYPVQIIEITPPFGKLVLKGPAAPTIESETSEENSSEADGVSSLINEKNKVRR